MAEEWLKCPTLGTLSDWRTNRLSWVRWLSYTGKNQSNDLTFAGDFIEFRRMMRNVALLVTAVLEYFKSLGWFSWSNYVHWPGFRKSQGTLRYGSSISSVQVFLIFPQSNVPRLWLTKDISNEFLMCRWWYRCRVTKETYVLMLVKTCYGIWPFECVLINIIRRRNSRVEKIRSWLHSCLWPGKTVA